MDKKQIIAFENEVYEQANWMFFQLELGNSKNLLPESDENFRELSKEDIKTIDDLLNSSEEIVSKNKLKKKLCAALESTSDSLKDYSLTVTTVLLPLVLTGVISANPLILAAITVVIFRTGVKAWCAE
ncbi:MAG: hypothetical protein KDC34_18760 [Saprospiraceae bacterium]|nr:hypothetical protein [Saprospiraceae bacterium]